ncbi:hypothetical protein FQA39_LY11590 [Lamprigera yunnana]|nr:hypothetical protein FQA39_LY11590 [Lamprigera yunnana]
MSFRSQLVDLCCCIRSTANESGGVENLRKTVQKSYKKKRFDVVHVFWPGPSYDLDEKTQKETWKTAGQRKRITHQSMISRVICKYRKLGHVRDLSKSDKPSPPKDQLNVMLAVQENH